MRYADDIAIFASSQRSAERILESVVKWLNKELKLEVNQTKSGTGPTEQSGLLGFRIDEEGTIEIGDRAVQRLKERVHELWDARQSKTSQQLSQQWQNYIKGWWNYYQLAERQWNVKDLSGWIRRHMRKCFWQRWHDRKGRRYPDLRPDYKVATSNRLLLLSSRSMMRLVISRQTPSHAGVCGVSPSAAAEPAG